MNDCYSAPAKIVPELENLRRIKREVELEYFALCELRKIAAELNSRPGALDT